MESQNLSTLLYLASGVLFIIALRGLARPIHRGVAIISAWRVWSLPLQLRWHCSTVRAVMCGLPSSQASPLVASSAQRLPAALP